LLLDGENTGDGALRDAKSLVITNEQFEQFLERHKALKCLVPEDNTRMRDSYLILDEKLCFLNCTGGSKTPSRSIREVSVVCALREAGFDADMFVKRGGIYEWSRPSQSVPIDVEDLAIDRKRAEKNNVRCVHKTGAQNEMNARVALAVAGVVVIGALQLLALRRARLSQ